MMMGAANAQDPASCPYLVERNEGTQIQQLWSEDTQSCFFSVAPLNSYVDLIYRDHLFTSDGLFMVFNSYGKGPDAETTGAREFYMFPRPLNKFSYEWVNDTQELIVTHVTGEKFIFDARKARLRSMTKAKVVVADYVEKTNRGGVEISDYQGLILDGGFQMGRPPTANSGGTSVLKDINGKTCAVKNSEIFKYTTGGDVILKYSDATLPAFLKKRCPSLKKP